MRPDVKNPEIKTEESQIKQASKCMETLKELLDTNKYLPHKPEKLISTCDEAGRKYRYQKRWFHILALLFYEIKELSLSDGLMREIDRFTKCVMHPLRHKNLTDDIDVQLAVELMQKIMEELEEIIRAPRNSLIKSINTYTALAVEEFTTG